MVDPDNYCPCCGKKTWAENSPCPECENDADEEHFEPEEMDDVCDDMYDGR